MMRITGIEFTPAGPGDQVLGLLGWVRCVLDGAVVLDGVAVRRTEDGRIRLSFPARRDGRGVQRFFLRPIDDRARLAIEDQILSALDLGEAAL